MKSLRGTLHAYYDMKSAYLKKLHTIWLYVYDILEKAEMWRQSKYQAGEYGSTEDFIGQ